MLGTISNLIIIRSYPLYIKGFLITLEIAFLSFFIALILGLFIVSMRLSKNKMLNLIGNFLIQLIRNTPLLVSLVWVYYALPALTGITLGAKTSAIIAIALQSAGYQTEVYRAGIESIHRDQISAAKALGMPPFLLMRRIVFPQAIRRIIPPTINVFCTSLKSTSLVSFIAVEDLMYQSQLLTAYYYKPLEIYTTVAVIYIFMVGFTAYLADVLDKKIKKGEVKQD